MRTHPGATAAAEPEDAPLEQGTEVTMTDRPACVGADPALFDPMSVDEAQQYKCVPVERVPRIGEALAYCRRCPVTEWCGERGGAAAGVWGGQYVPRESLRSRGIAA